MALIDDVFRICNRLADAGWRDLLLEHGLDIRHGSAADLGKALAADLPAVRRGVKGFEDFAQEGRRGVEPGLPARSLLYHALASPNVLNGADGRRLGAFPTPRELDAVENYVFGATPPAIADLLKRAGAAALSVAVFAVEYRPASQTCHKLHADLVFARTGVARVGTAPPLYDPARRGFLPEDESDPFAIRVSPARYAAYLAARLPPDPAARRPMSPQPGDDGRRFWVPVHKLFPGRECLQGVGTRLGVRFSAYHVNEKVHRVHRAAGTPAPPAGPPYVLTGGIAELALTTDRDYAPGTLVPVPHDRRVAPAADAAGNPVGYHVPPSDTRFSSYEPDQPDDGVRFPEYVHARTEILPSGQQVDLNADPDVLARVATGGYQALNYVDFTGEGWVKADCPQLSGQPGIGDPAPPAYSLVTAPDFFPTCDQRELTEWAASTAVPQFLRTQIWNFAPEPLSSTRLPANLQLRSPAPAPFDPTEQTVTALVPLLGTPTAARTEPPPADALRHSHLPDDAAGVFAPGWDCTQDTTDDGVKHLAGYGLGSPFPEDAKLCAALSTFWPAVAPDATREMEPLAGHQSGTVAPLTDAEIGQVGGLPWDGVRGPVVVAENGAEYAEYPSFQHVDYVRNALDRKFTLRLTARVTPNEYKRRVLGLACAYLALGAERTGNTGAPVPLRGDKGERKWWKVLSFRAAGHGDPDREQAQQEAGTVLPGEAYRVVVFPVAAGPDGTPSAGPVLPGPDARRARIRIPTTYTLFVDPNEREVLLKGRSDATWRRGVVLV